MKNLLQKSIFIALLFVTYFASAQTKGTVSGKVLNGKDKTPIDYASVAIKKLYGDSAVVGTGMSTSTGTFSVADVPTGKYRLFVAFLGLKSVTKDFELTAAQPGINFGDLIMDDDGITLAGVEVKGEVPPVKVKKDTLEFNAGSFKVKENAVVEDVLKKLPGVEVSKDGTITTQGETIKRVRVDGKDFMGNDPLLATRNLPADMIDKIQIIDDMSDQSKFSGVDDGNREKIINITTRQDKKNGFFGNSTVGVGTDDRYDVNLNVNKFKNNEQMSLVGQFNNVNKQNFGGGVSGGGGGRGFGGGGGGGQQQGITTTNMAGFNYANVYKSGTTFNASYNFNKTSLFNDQNSLTQNLLGNSSRTSNDDIESTTERLNHRLNVILDTKIDSTISLRWQPNLSYTDNNGNSVTNYVRQFSSTNTIGLQKFLSNSTSPSLSNNILLRKKFQRRGRTLSLNVSTSYNNTDSENNNYIKDDVTVGTNNSINLTDQLNEQGYTAFSNTARLVFTEPLSKTLNLELNYNNGYSYDDQERLVYNYNSVTKNYDLLDALYSNHFENTTLTNAVGFSLNKNEKKYNWQLGLAVQNVDRENVNKTDGKIFNQNFTNLTPSAQFRYNFSQNKRLRIQYNGRTQQPSIAQIQPILDNTNNQSVVDGNPNLKPAFNNNLSIFYNNFDFASFRTLFIGGFFNQYFNAIGNTQRLITDQSDKNYGKVEQGFVNVDGNFSGNVFGNLSQPIIKGNKLNLQINLGGSYSQSTNFTPSKQNILEENITKEYSFNNGYKLVSNMDKLDLSAGISGTVSRATYSAQPEGNTKFYRIIPTIDASYMFPGNIRLQADWNYNRITGLGAYNSNYSVINAFVSRQFFKNKGTFKFSVNDLLNENTGIIRTASNNTITDLNFNVLKRYYMLSFTYSLGNIGGRSVGGMQMPGQGGGMQRTRM